MLMCLDVIKSEQQIDKEQILGWKLHSANYEMPLPARRRMKESLKDGL